MPKDKKRKRTENADPLPNGHSIDTSKPSALFKPIGARSHTLSVALPGSIVANAVSHDQKTYLAGTIARALAVFCVDEIIIFNDSPVDSSSPNDKNGGDKYTAFSDPCHFLAHLLSYLETPAYLRKSLFPMHPNLRTAGNLPSLDMPHHLRAAEWSDYREGVTVSSSSVGTVVDVGLPQKRELKDVEIPPNVRVTLKLIDKKGSAAEAVPPTEPREVHGYYWGYSVRRCATLSSVFTECPYDGGYDLSFGTSERGKPLSQSLMDDFPPYSHLLVVLGGVAGLETAAKNDPELASKGITATNIGELFDQWVNVLPGQGSRTIRTEEAVWLGLMGLQSVVEKRRTQSG